jgi:hypothetical protein
VDALAKIIVLRRLIGSRQKSRYIMTANNIENISLVDLWKIYDSYWHKNYGYPHR